jgi:hypothetical protein
MSFRNKEANISSGNEARATFKKAIAVLDSF